MAVTNRRRRLIVDPKLQKRIILAAGWPPCLVMAGSILLLGFFCTRLSREALEAGVELPSLLWVFLATASFIVVATIFVLWTALRISHRIAGPTQVHHRRQQQESTVFCRGFNQLGMRAPDRLNAVVHASPTFAGDIDHGPSFAFS